jgi:hypothetical protein
VRAQSIPGRRPRRPAPSSRLPWEHCAASLRDDQAGKPAPKKWRNHIIGQLIITAVQEGLVRHYVKKKTWKKHDPNVLPPCMWPTVDPTEAEKGRAPRCTCDQHDHLQGVLRELGIGKQHEGTWRRA